MSHINSIVVFLDKITGTIAEANSANKTKYIKDGKAFITVRGKQENLRVSWMGADPDMLDKGVTVFADIDTSEYNGKTFTSINIRKVTPAFSSVNQAMITGKVIGFKEYQKMLSVEVEVSSLDWKTKTNVKAIQKVSVMDKTSAVANSIKTNVNSEMLLLGTLSANNGYSDYTITSAAVLNGGASTASPASSAPEEDSPF